VDYAHSVIRYGSRHLANKWEAEVSFSLSPYLCVCGGEFISSSPRTSKLLYFPQNKLANIDALILLDLLGASVRSFISLRAVSIKAR
jgi:hypothetical protein